MKDIQVKLKKLPEKPGVYFFKDKTSKTIYIGKAVNLKNRVKSYWQKTTQLGAWTQKMVSEICDIDFKEVPSEFEALLLEANLINSRQPYYNIRSKDDKSFLLIAVTKDDYPRILATRNRVLNADYFGPFTSANEVRRVLKTVRRIFPYCTCKPKTGRPCMYYHLGLCPGCCFGYPKAEYQKTVKKIIKLLRGNSRRLILSLKKEMADYSEKQEYEKAAQVRKQIEALINVTLNWQTLSNESLSLELKRDREKQLLAQARLIYPELKSLNRVECYDISNLFGGEATGSMVVFENGQPCKNEYRKFKIRQPSEPDDVGMMFEVISRRLKHKEWIYPDILLVDGGKGQLGAAFSALRNVYLEKKIKLLSLAKREEIIIKPEISGWRIIGFKEIKLAKNSILLQFFQELRNESHRFAKKYHTLLRKKKLNQ